MVKIDSADSSFYTFNNQSPLPDSVSYTTKYYIVVQN